MGWVRISWVKFYIAALKKRPIVLVSLLLIAATGSMAMSLGRNRGVALVGRPLNISMQAVLDAHETALLRIEALWPSSKVLELIEESIFRRPDATTKAFDLEAYRELLLLYGVAKEIVKPELSTDDGAMFFDLPEVIQEATNPQPAIKASTFMATSIQPLSATVRKNKHQKTVSAPLSVLPKPSPRLSLDIDLNELASDNEGVHPVPESGLGNVIEFDFSDSHLNSSSRRKP